MANPEFSFIYEVTIRQYKEDGLFNETTYDEHDVLILANGLREATEKAEDYAEDLNQDGPYKFYDVVSVQEVDTVYTGRYEEENDCAENPDDPIVGQPPPAVPTPPAYSYWYIGSNGQYTPCTYPENVNTTTVFGGLSCS